MGADQQGLGKCRRSEKWLQDFYPFLSHIRSHPHPVMGPGKRQEMVLLTPDAVVCVVFPFPPAKVR